MENVQSILVLLALVALAFSPVVYLWARRRDAEPQPNPDPHWQDVPGVMSGRELLAHHLYGQAVGWAPQAMQDYDDSPAVQATWEAEAGHALGRRPRH